MRYGMVDENVIVGDGSEIGDEKSSRERIALIGRGKELAAGAKVASGEIVD